MLLWSLKENLPTILLILVIIVDIFTIVRILIDSNNTSKALSYILVVIAVPILGSIIYFTFGINYRKRKIFSKKIFKNEHLYQQIEQNTTTFNKTNLESGKELLGTKLDVAQLIINDNKAAISFNDVKVLVNGEAKFEKVLEDLANAKSYIHLEYYIFEPDNIGQKIMDLLCQKAIEGIQVRMIYDDFGSNNLKRKHIKKLQNSGVQVFPFNKIRFIQLANRFNYRDHRKIIIIDGTIGYLGGINVSDKYINAHEAKSFFWRDAHFRIQGAAVSSLQYHFIANWNFCSKSFLNIEENLFPIPLSEKRGNHLVQIIAGGPDYPSSSIMLSFFTAIVSAQERIWITTPYFIPNESILDAIKSAALKGKDVRLLLPGISDSSIVNAASRSYFPTLLKSGVKIYAYQKGFVHAKTMIVDNNLAIVGTANMDHRSFDTNFEINAVIYSLETVQELHTTFENDLKESRQITYLDLAQRPVYRKLLDGLAKLLSPLL